MKNFWNKPLTWKEYWKDSFLFLAVFYAILGLAVYILAKKQEIIRTISAWKNCFRKRYASGTIPREHKNEESDDEDFFE